MILPQDEARARCDLRWSVILFMAYIVVFFLTCCLLSDASEVSEVSDESRINAYIDHFHRLVRKSKARKAKQYTRMIVTESRTRGLDPLLVAVLVALEATYLPTAEGTRGERGLLQVMPQHCKGCDLSTPVGQIRAGTDRLKLAFDTCGTLSGALTHYASGRCVSKSKRTRKKIQWRVKYYKRMKERFDNGH